MAVPKFYEYSGLHYEGLGSGERLIGKGMMAYWVPILTFGSHSSSDSHSGTIYVTDRRVFFRTMWCDYLEFQLKLSEIAGFYIGRRAFFTQVTLYTADREKLRFTGFYAKKLQDWLREAGISRL